MNSAKINGTMSAGNVYEKANIVSPGTSEDSAVESVMSSMKKMIPNWSFTTNARAQQNTSIQDLVNEPKDAIEIPEEKEPDGSWLV